MEGEYNKVDTDNIKTTFDNDTNNIAQSDELEAGPVATIKMGTAYSASKKISRAVVIAGFTISVTATAVLGSGIGKNVYVKNVPVLGVVGFEFKKDTFKLLYTFSLKENKNSYPITFSVVEDKEKTIYTLDCSKVNMYTGEVVGFTIGHEYVYKISFSNNLDYIGILRKGTVETYKEAHYGK